MKSHPILFKGEMIRAILAATKTQTRRVVSFRNSTVLGYRSRPLWNELDWTRVCKDHGPHMMHDEASEYLHVGAPDDTQRRVRWHRERLSYRARGANHLVLARRCLQTERKIISAPNYFEFRACKDLGYKSVSIDSEEAYCEIAAKRMAQEVLAI